MRTTLRDASTLALCLAVSAAANAAEEPVLNLYSARHYQTDEALYANFTKATGIKINRIEAGDEQLIERMKNEGAASPADVLLTVDAARLWQAQQLGLFQPVKSAVLDERIPATLRDPDGNWFGFSYRARVIVYNKADVKPADVATYEELADPKYKGKVCTRSGSPSVQPVADRRDDRARRRSEGRGMGEGRRRQPGAHAEGRRHRPDQGGRGRRMRRRDRQHVLLRAPAALDQAGGQARSSTKTGVVWPNQKTHGTHVNISGGGVLKNAPHRENAIKFLEYLASDEAQPYFADGNNEWPVVKSGEASGIRRSIRWASSRPIRLPIAVLGQEHGRSAEDLRPRRLEVTRGARGNPVRTVRSASDAD